MKIYTQKKSYKKIFDWEPYAAANLMSTWLMKKNHMELNFSKTHMMRTQHYAVDIDDDDDNERSWWYDNGSIFIISLYVVRLKQSLNQHFHVILFEYYSRKWWISFRLFLWFSFYVTLTAFTSHHSLPHPLLVDV